eukprot:15340159-Ditylum_brightwellii.AAC.1
MTMVLSTTAATTTTIIVTYNNQPALSQQLKEVIGESHGGHKTNWDVQGLVVNHGGKVKPSFAEPKTWVQFLFGLLVVEMQVRTYVEEASGSAEPSGHSTHVASLWHMGCRSRCHPGEGKKWAHESEHCVQQPVCNTTHIGRIGLIMVHRPGKVRRQN